jgi:hypothetical protein
VKMGRYASVTPPCFIVWATRALRRGSSTLYAVELKFCRASRHSTGDIYATQ